MFYLLAKAVILYYLIPLPFLKKLYLRALQPVVRKNRLAVTRIATAWTNYAVHADGRLYFNDYTKIQTAIVAVWVLGVSIMLVSQLAGYVRMTRRFAGYANAIMADRHRKVIDELKEEYGVKRSIALYYGRRGEAAMTFGLFSPIIICGKDPESREAQLLIRHELVHIRRMDVFWKMLMQFVRLSLRRDGDRGNAAGREKPVHAPDYRGDAGPEKHKGIYRQMESRVWKQREGYERVKRKGGESDEEKEMQSVSGNSPCGDIGLCQFHYSVCIQGCLS